MLESGSLFMLIAALLIGCNSIIIRHLSAKDDPVCITFYFTLTGVVASSIAIALFGWVMPSSGDWIFLIAVGLFGGVAQYLMTVSYRHSEIAVVAPLKFLSIVMGGLIAYLVWAEIPDLQSLVGISIIVGAGLYAMHRELLLARRAKR